MRRGEKPLVWLRSEIRTPPFSKEARIEAGVLLRRLQRGEPLSMPHSRPLSTIGARCHELRIRDREDNWRIVYRVDDDAIVIADVFAKTTRATPRDAVLRSRQRLQRYDQLFRKGD